MSPYERGRNDCAQDDMENAQFSSVGGLDNRENLIPPKYIHEDDIVAYLAGYTYQALLLYGSDWRTTTFSWKPVLKISPEEDPSKP